MRDQLTKVSRHMIRVNKKTAGTMIAALVLGLVLFSGLEFISAGGQPSAATSQAKFNVSDGQWSDASIWNDGKLPGAGDAVKIEKNSRVVYDVFSEVEIGELTIGGSLIFSRSVSTNLDVGDVNLTKYESFHVTAPRILLCCAY